MSPLSPEQASAAFIQRGALTASRAGIFWLEFDPATGNNLLRKVSGGASHPVTGPEFGIRSEVNGYGGGALCAGPDALFAVAASGQQIHRIDPRTGASYALTRDRDASFGGLVWDDGHHRVLAVRESTGCQQLVAIQGDNNVLRLHESEDFYSAPALSASGTRIAWVCWSLPDMPWVSSVLWAADVDVDGALVGARCLPTPTGGSVQQPVFDGEELHVLSDHEGWWQPWQVSITTGQPRWTRLDATAADQASAPWQLGERHHWPLGQGGWARVRYVCGSGELWLTRSAESPPVRVAADYTDFRHLMAFNDELYCIARSASRLDSVLAVNPETGHARTLAGGETPFPDTPIVTPETFRVPPSANVREEVSGFLYPPVEGRSENTPPPLILIAHGGPTSTAWPVFNPQVQFWCHHGFAVAEVNYRGSAGFGRDFRLALAGCWGQADVEDMERVADYLVARGRGDATRLFIQGRSSGGYTVLMAMTRSQRFRAGASLFGVSDPAHLREVTHRFESGYLDWLLGPPDDFPGRWQARTPVLQAHRIRRPMIFFQGGQDRVVVPEQTRAMVKVLEQSGQAVELWWFEDEGHGFRQRRNQIALLENLLAFYRRCSQKCDDGG
ncbi:alpha/beta hydrolase family protein [Marinobacter panjinensis]|uniref:alpha/beta hydrolase family protein n=1 Tax=Marinobacter panjinensis TaxID=2576384 RepID=UPI001D18300B|nr:prolyl oligopeptidase family serine peptidase [Marinobacter panjinensis]MCR8916156.1 prolyl oligopeptidase family serine peptidase [Marinobacter panjinensis]